MQFLTSEGFLESQQRGEAQEVGYEISLKRVWQMLISKLLLVIVNVLFTIWVNAPFCCWLAKMLSPWSNRIVYPI